MTKRSLVTITVGVLAVIIAGAVLWYYFGPGNRRVKEASTSPVVGKAAVGQPAPSFEVATTDGLFNLRTSTKPVFLEVFATWCPHCQRETTVVDRLYHNYRSRVDFVGVSGSTTGMDGTSASSELDVLDWVRRFNVQYPVAYDPLLNVANLYLQGGFPTFAIIGRDKRVSYLNSGEVSYQELSGQIDKVLRRSGRS
jgi:cytochrome c biogenesis protein CcmG, thiol:disulfide interchange protein DsbE